MNAVVVDGQVIPVHHDDNKFIDGEDEALLADKSAEPNLSTTHVKGSKVQILQLFSSLMFR